MSLRAWLKSFKKSTSGNATLLVAVGMPMLIGSSGLAVDVAQWYMWRNELQYAVDQAALAGAWARTATATQDTYITRARQEFTANVSTTASFADTPAVSLVNYAGGTANAVSVSVTATRTLPFTGLMMNRGVTIRAAAQAKFAAGQAYTSCMVATDPTNSGSVTIGGSTVFTAACGIASLSNSASSVIVNGNPTIDAGYILSKGGIDDWFDLNTNDEVHEYMTNLFDPFASLSPPTNATPRAYACTGGTYVTQATVTTVTTITYSYWQGSSQSNLTPYSGYSNVRSNPTPTSSTVNNQVVTNNPAEGSSTTTSNTTYQKVAENGNLKIWEGTTTTVVTTYTNVAGAWVNQVASMQPGTYTGGFKVSCTTTLAGGIYVIDGGGIDIDGQYAVTGSGVMFVLKNGAYLKINGGTAINLTAPTASQFQTYGSTAAVANQLAGIMVFEDRASAGSNKTTINGTTSTVLNGYMYFPVSTVNFAGTAKVTSQCLMIVARNIVLAGTTNMTSFCPSGMTQTTNVSGATAEVRLIS